ncbi:MAG: DsbC family protein [Gammaproteobacteria bacterium]|nr:DsbC family protein [Gammaproteobacteria bacterium]
MKSLLYVVLLLGAAGTATAEPSAAISAALQRLLPGQAPDAIKPAPMPGWQEVVFGARVFYLSDNGRYLMDGNLVDTESRINLTNTRVEQLRHQMVGGIDDNETIIFGPELPKYRVTVFTDIDCGYCRKLHQEMAGFNELGIEIRYLFFPRAGIGSASYDKAVSVWCADDRKAAITAAKLDQPVPSRTCDNPVKAQFELGEMVGVSGTPALMLEDGALLPGYLPPERLIQVLQARSAL